MATNVVDIQSPGRGPEEVNNKRMSQRIPWDMTDVLPCPFCGSKDAGPMLQPSPDLFAVVCCSCFSVTAGTESPKAAVERWNMRAASLPEPVVLKPCPFCASAEVGPYEWKHLGTWGVICGGCYSMTGAAPTCDGAVEAWERRITD